MQIAQLIVASETDREVSTSVSVTISVTDNNATVNIAGQTVEGKRAALSTNNFSLSLNSRQLLNQISHVRVHFINITN